MMKSRYDKMMHDYTTQSKYKNDAYLNPVNKAVKEVQQPIDKTIQEVVPSTPVEAPVQVKPDIEYIGKDEYWPSFLQSMTPNDPLRVLLMIEPEMVLTKLSSRDELVQEVMKNLSSDAVIGPNVTDTQFGVGDLNPLTKYFANAKAAYNPVLDEVQLDQNAGLQEAYHEILHASVNQGILKAMSEAQKNELYSKVMNPEEMAWSNRDTYAARPFMSRD